MTKKQLNKIKSDAFKSFKSDYTEEEFNNLFCGTNLITVWRVEGDAQRKLIITQYDTQMNMNCLKNYGFTEDAEVEKLFIVDRQRKVLDFVGSF